MATPEKNMDKFSEFMAAAKKYADLSRTIEPARKQVEIWEDAKEILEMLIRELDESSS